MLMWWYCMICLYIIFLQLDECLLAHTRVTIHVISRIYDSPRFPRGWTQSPPNKAQQHHFIVWEAFKVILANAFLVQSIVSLARVPRLQTWHSILHNVSTNYLFCLQENPCRSRLSPGNTSRCWGSSDQRKAPTYWQACLRSNRSWRKIPWSFYFCLIQICRDL